MSEFLSSNSAQTFAPLEISLKLALAIAIGLLVGLEREWSQKDLGARTFAITSILGTLSILTAPIITCVSFVGVLIVVTLTGMRHVRENKPVETTTSAALILTFVLGSLVGQGHHYTPVAAAIVMTLLLSLKPQLIHFTGDLKVDEVRSAVLLGLLAFVIYPVLPDRAIDPWNLINPREAWLTVIVIAALGFLNYVLLKAYSARGLYYTAILGGMVNSTATIAEISESFKGPQDVTARAIIIDLLTVVAMFVRNVLVLALFARSAVARAAAPLAAMTAAATFVIWLKRSQVKDEIGPLKLSSPLSISKVLQFGLIFLVIEVIGSLGQRFLGHYGFLLVSVIGGLVSSASTTGAAATLAMHGKITPEAAGVATVLTSMASALSNIPVLHHQVRRWNLTRQLAMLSLGIVAAGIAAMFFFARLT